MPKRQLLKNLQLDEVSTCGQGVNRHAKVVLLKAHDAVEKREFSAERRQQLAEEGKALSDGSYPIVNRTDLSNAIQAFGRADNKAQVARHIKRRARELDAEDALPEDGMLAKADEREALAETLTSTAMAAVNKAEDVPNFEDIVREHMRARDAERAFNDVMPMLDAFRSSVEAAIQMSEDDEQRRDMIRRNADQFAERVSETVGKSTHGLQDLNGLLKSMVNGLRKMMAQSGTSPSAARQDSKEETEMSKDNTLEQLPEDLRKTAEQIPEEHREAFVALAKRAAEAEQAQETVRKELDELKKNQKTDDNGGADKPDPSTPEGQLAKAREEGAPASVVEMLKAQIEQNQKNTEALAKMQREREEGAYAEIVKGFSTLSVKDPEAFAKALRRLAKGEPEEGDENLLLETLKAADAQLKEATLYASAGSADSGNASGAMSDAEKAVDSKARELQKAHTDWSYEKAYSQALRDNPELQQRLMSEGGNA